MHRLQKLLLIPLLTCLGPLVEGSDIIHGEKAPEGSMLYMASVQRPTGHVCGGFLIAEDFVVTAAHCFDSYLSHVVLGTHDLAEGLGERIEIEEKLMYSNYSNIKTGGDIMLLRLSRKAKLGHTVKLPHAEVNLEENEVCQVAGWGKTETAAQSHELRVVDVSVINPQMCQEQWHSSLPPSVICAGGYKTHKGFCQGDSGGPLVCNGVAVGVVSFNKNSNCEYPDVPNVYTDVSRYLQWISLILKRPKHLE